LAGKAKGLFQPASRSPAARAKEFWALQDVSFEVQKGDRIGIVGRNGAGKSTLLKILSRITEPTRGRISMRGRVASLLEVGTGFHPELSGRENIYLNGAILGMNRLEIRRKFDEIVAFAEVEQFLDTPVKRYSSGMYVRLAFAVAAHMEPEILVVDEVLAVGDMQFQQKCLGKMQNIATEEGRTMARPIGLSPSTCWPIATTRADQGITRLPWDVREIMSPGYRSIPLNLRDYSIGETPFCLSLPYRLMSRWKVFVLRFKSSIPISRMFVTS
jgi:ABC-type polysaccharide/polyol phosphate transport system ATPase subunit